MPDSSHKYNTTDVSIRSGTASSTSSSIFGNGSNQTLITVTAKILDNNLPVANISSVIKNVELIDYNAPGIVRITDENWACAGKPNGYFRPFNINQSTGAALQTSESDSGYYSWQFYVSTSIDEKSTIQLGVLFTFTDSTTSAYYSGGNALKNPSMILIIAEKPIIYSSTDTIKVTSTGWQNYRTGNPWAYTPSSLPGITIAGSNGVTQQVTVLVSPDITTPTLINTFNNATTIQTGPRGPTVVNSKKQVADPNPYTGALVNVCQDPFFPDAVVHPNSPGGGHIVAWYVSPTYNPNNPAQITIGFKAAGSDINQIQFISDASTTYINQAQNAQSSISISGNTGSFDNSSELLPCALNAQKKLNIAGFWLGIDTTDGEVLLPKNWSEQQIPPRKIHVVDDYGNEGTFHIGFNNTDSTGKPYISIEF